MEQATKVMLGAAAGVLGAVVLFGLTIHPFGYGFGESFLVAVGVVLVVLFQTVLDDTSF